MNAHAAHLHTAPLRATPRSEKHPRFTIDEHERGAWLQFLRVRSFVFKRVNIFLPDLPTTLHGLRILHLSDLHVRGSWQPAYDTLLSRLHERPPDLILVTGDFVEDRADHRGSLPALKRLVTQLPSRLGIWGILGNHDGDLLAPRLGDWGVHLLADRVARIANHEAAIELVGIRSVHRWDFNERFAESIAPLEPSVPRLLLSHFPDNIRKLRSVGVHVMLTGHTHGGQVCLPTGIPIITHDSLPRSMCKGIHAVDEKLLIINRGLGFASMAMRLFCPPEVIEIQLQPQINAD